MLHLSAILACRNRDLAVARDIPVFRYAFVFANGFGINGFEAGDFLAGAVGLAFVVVVTAINKYQLSLPKGKSDRR